MRPIIKTVAAVAALTAFAAAPSAFAANTTGPWSGAFAGGQLGLNQVSSDHTSSENALNLGIYGGYQMQFARHFVLGGDVFYNWNQKKDHAVYNDAGTHVGTANFGTNTYGIDFLGGFPVGSMSHWMPYVKLGYGWANLQGSRTSSGSENAVRYGAGIAWMPIRHLSFNVQYMHQNFGSGANDNLQNDNWTVGATWHFSPSY